MNKEWSKNERVKSLEVVTAGILLGSLVLVTRLITGATLNGGFVVLHFVVMEEWLIHLR